VDCKVPATTTTAVEASGWFEPPADGNYSFWVQGTGTTEVSKLQADGSLIVIASSDALKSDGAGSYYGNNTQRSDPIEITNAAPVLVTVRQTIPFDLNQFAFLIFLNNPTSIV
jgi:hypothetical protein